MMDRSIYISVRAHTPRTAGEEAFTSERVGNWPLNSEVEIRTALLEIEKTIRSHQGNEQAPSDTSALSVLRALVECKDRYETFRRGGMMAQVVMDERQLRDDTELAFAQARRLLEA